MDEGMISAIFGLAWYVLQVILGLGKSRYVGKGLRKMPLSPDLILRLSEWFLKRTGIVLNG